VTGIQGQSLLILLYPQAEGQPLVRYLQLLVSYVPYLEVTSHTMSWWQRTHLARDYGLTLCCSAVLLPLTFKNSALYLHILLICLVWFSEY